MRQRHKPHRATETAVPANQCTCGYRFECATPAAGVNGTAADVEPAPGDLTLCMRCARVWQFTDSMGIRAFDVEQLDETQRREVRRAQAAIHHMRRTPS